MTQPYWIWFLIVFIPKPIGDVMLQNLRLKKDALSKLNLPIDVVDGRIECSRH